MQKKWAAIEPVLPTDVRGVERADDQPVLSGIFWRLRTGAPRANIPTRYGRPRLPNPFVRWRERGIWDQLLAAVSEAYDLDQMIDAPACAPINMAAAKKDDRFRCMGCSQSGPTSKVKPLVDSALRRGLRVAVAPLRTPGGLALCRDSGALHAGLPDLLADREEADTLRIGRAEHA